MSNTILKVKERLINIATLKETGWHIEDILIILAILLQDAGTFGFLPINIFQIIILILLGVIIYKHRLKVFKEIPLYMLYLFTYISIITFINIYDIDSIKSVGYFILQMITIYFYMHFLEDKKKILKIIYICGFILSAYGIIQTIAYALNIEWIYNTTLYGFVSSVNMSREKASFRPFSIYSEPSHLCSVVGASIFIGLSIKDEIINKTKTIIILIFAILTKSILVYISVIMFFIAYILIYKKGVKEKVICLALIFVMLIGFIIIKPDIFNAMQSKINSLISPDSNSSVDLTGFAIVSNMNVSIEKMKDGNIFGTGMDSHRLTYRQYMDKIYEGKEVLMYLNNNDAATMFVRILSEFGIVGLAIYIITLTIKVCINIKEKNPVSLFFIVLLLVSILRNGTYVNLLHMIAFVVVLYDNPFIKNEGDKK